MQGLRIVSFIHDIACSFSDPLALSQQWYGMIDIVYGVLGDFDTQDHLLVGVHSNRGFQEVLSRFTRSPGVVVTGIRAGEP